MSTFDEYPRLRRAGHSDEHGRIELLSVNETSDGFLTAWARLGEGVDAFEHSVFLGRADDFKAPAKPESAS